MQWYLKISLKVLVIRNNTAPLLLQPNGSATVEVQPVYKIHDSPNRHI